MAALARCNCPDERAQLPLLAPQAPGPVAERAETRVDGDLDMAGPFVHVAKVPISADTRNRATVKCRRRRSRAGVPLSPVPERPGRRIFHGRRFSSHARDREPAILAIVA